VCTSIWPSPSRQCCPGWGVEQRWRWGAAAGGSRGGDTLIPSGTTTTGVWGGVVRECAFNQPVVDQTQGCGEERGFPRGHSTDLVHWWFRILLHKPFAKKPDLHIQDRSVAKEVNCNLSRVAGGLGHQRCWNIRATIDEGHRSQLLPKIWHKGVILAKMSFATDETA